MHYGGDLPRVTRINLSAHSEVTVSRGTGVEAQNLYFKEDPLKTLKPKSLSRLWRLSTLLALSSATACQPELDEIPLHMERAADTLRFSWEGDKLHRFEVVQCDESSQLAQEHCSCNGSLVWGLGPSETEKFHDVAREEPFLASPLQYGVAPESDRKGYAARPLQTGRTYLVRAVRVGPCEDNPLDCQQMTAQGCQQFTW